MQIPNTIERITIVTGCQRSGTTLTGQILGAHPSAFLIDETDELYQLEAAKIATLEKICSNNGMEPVCFNLSEFMKSGALLSCMVMKLNYSQQMKSLV